MKHTDILKLRFGTAPVEGGFMGFIQCLLNERVLWSQQSDIVRLTRDDAKADAVALKEDTESYNCMRKVSA